MIAFVIAGTASGVSFVEAARRRQGAEVRV